MGSDTVAVILAESEAVCEGCGADPRVERDLSRWHMDIEQTPDGLRAIVRCPACW